jgi:hypothetical protein
MMSEVSETGDNATAEGMKATSIEVENADVKRVDLPAISSNFEYDDDENEPELHARTYVALLAMFLLNMVQVLALQGPPAVVRGCRHQIWNTILTIVADIYRTRSQRCGPGDVDSELPFVGSGCSRPCHLLRLGYVSSAQVYSSHLLNHIFHRRSNCARRKRNWPSHRGPNPNWFWIRHCTSRILCS